MSSGYGYGYQEYGGNPYGQATPGDESNYGSATPYREQGNPYGTTSTAQGNPYGTTSTAQPGYGGASASQSTAPAVHDPSALVGHHGAGGAGYGSSAGYGTSAPPPLVQQDSDYSTAQTPAANTSNTYGNNMVPYGGQPGVVTVEAPPRVMNNQEFLSRVEAIRGEIRELTTNIGEIGSVHQRLISSPDANHGQLDNLVSNTQILNTKIQSQIRQLEADALKSGDNTTKKSQIRTLKGYFRTQLEDYQKEEAAYKQRYQDQIAREYRIVNPEASDAEVREATEADWGNEGVFQTALKSNRTGAANSVLGSVRARHNDIQRIEKTLIELSQMFTDLAATVELQEPQVVQAEEGTKQTIDNTEKANEHLDKANASARNRRKLKWWCFGIVVLVLVILAAVLGGYFGSQANNKKRRRHIEEPFAEEARLVAEDMLAVKRFVERAFTA